jgi:hypothetical protein
MYAAAPHTVKGRQIDVKPQVRYQIRLAVILIPHQMDTWHVAT